MLEVLLESMALSVIISWSGLSFKSFIVNHRTGTKSFVINLNAKNTI